MPKRFFQNDILLGALLVGIAVWGLSTHWWGLTPTKPAKGHTESNANKFAECPVCGMTIEVKPDTPRTEYKGKTYYFMNDEMKEEFVKSPDQFIK